MQGQTRPARARHFARARSGNARHGGWWVSGLSAFSGAPRARGAATLGGRRLGAVSCA
jgi:hypothetical protein